MEKEPTLSLEELQHFAQHAYPSNHTYTIKNNVLKPTCKLSLRYKKISRLYPAPLTSLVDISCSKGFFIFAANLLHGATRNLGIDLHTHSIKHCRALKTHLQDSYSQFQILKLDELAARINEFGGPFQTSLLINCYQYIYFGSVTSPSCYLNHDEIFKHLRKITGERLIFSNRVELTDCQNETFVKQSSKEARNNYSEEKIISAAENYFSVTKIGKIGSYPLWALDVK